MYNRINQILEQYPLEIHETWKGRGATICNTDQGLKLLKEYKGSEARADFLHQVLQFLRENGKERVDYVVKTKEDKSIAVDTDGTTYIMRDWYQGKESDAKNRADILRSVGELAGIHTILRDYQEEIPEFLKVKTDALIRENEKHCRELKKVKNYIVSKKKKNDFEMKYVKHCGFFVEQANYILELQNKELNSQKESQEIYGICHGDFNHHNVLFSGEQVAVLNFERSMYDVQVSDLSNFMRKILEKHNWNASLGMDMLAAYEKIRVLSEAEKKQLYIRLAYPEKFWKISNQYFNTSKVWICGRNLEKLEKVIEQNSAKEQFLQIFSCNLVF